MKELAGFLEENRDGRVLILAHSQADMDAAASALALSSFFPDSRACVPDVLSSPGKRVLSRFGGKMEKWKGSEPSPGLIIVVDTNSFQMLPGMKSFLLGMGGKLAVIDHHSLHSDYISTGAGASFIDASASSTCEIIYELFKELNYPISSRVAELLLSGIVADSSDLRSASTRTLEIVAYLLKRTPLPLSTFFDLAEGIPSFSQRAQVLKALSGALISSEDGFVIASAKASSFEGVAADRLVSLGADYAFVLQQTKNELRISARCRPSLPSSVGADASKIMAEVGKFIGGSGGGHPAAAGADGPFIKKADEALALAVSLAKKQLSKTRPPKRK